MPLFGKGKATPKDAVPAGQYPAPFGAPNAPGSPYGPAAPAFGSPYGAPVGGFGAPAGFGPAVGPAAQYSPITVGAYPGYGGYAAAPVAASPYGYGAIGGAVVPSGQVVDDGLRFGGYGYGGFASTVNNAAYTPVYAGGVQGVSGYGGVPVYNSTFGSYAPQVYGGGVSAAYPQQFGGFAPTVYGSQFGTVAGVPSYGGYGTYAGYGGISGYSAPAVYGY